jgi:hypothetical protein
MGLLMWLLLFATTSVLGESSFITRIHDIDYGKDGEEDLVLLTNGQVLKLSPGPQKSLMDIEFARKAESKIHITFDDKRLIQDVRLLPQERPSLEPQTSTYIYTPTIIPDMILARQYFHEARYNSKESQCFNRAHVWAYEWFLKHQLYSNKTWLFFTRKYIRKFAFEWWFHVAPSVVVMENDQPRHKIMDIKYSRQPQDIKRWTDIFMRNDATCPMVKTYSDYANYPETGWCYTMRTSMFYFQPFDVEVMETWGIQKANWFEPEIKQSFKDALDEDI